MNDNAKVPLEDLVRQRLARMTHRTLVHNTKVILELLEQAEIVEKEELVSITAPADVIVTLCQSFLSFAGPAVNAANMKARLRSVKRPRYKGETHDN